MFILNYALGTILVHPDWDAVIQNAFRFATLGLSVLVLTYLSDILAMLDAAGGING